MLGFLLGQVGADSPLLSLPDPQFLDVSRVLLRLGEDAPYIFNIHIYIYIFSNPAFAG